MFIFNNKLPGLMITILNLLKQGALVDEYYEIGKKFNEISAKDFPDSLS